MINNELIENINDEEIIENVEQPPVDVAQLQPMSREDQATSQLQMDTPPTDEKQEEPSPDEKDPNKSGGFYPGSNYLFGNLENTMQVLSAPGLGLIDFGMDSVGNLPGMAPVDNAWDRITRLDNEKATAIRNFSSVVIPSMIGGAAVQAKLGAIKHLPRLQKALLATGLYTASEVAVIGLSDQGEEHNMARALADFIPGLFGPKGWIPISDSIKTLDSDSSTIRKRKNMYDTGVLSIFGTLIGAAASALSGSKKMGWFKPLDDTASAYKANEVLKNSDPETLLRMKEINDVIATGSLSKVQEENLINEYLNLENSLETVDDLEDALRQIDESRINEEGIAAQRKINNGVNPAEELDPDITPILEDGANARQTIPPGNVARNMADTTAIKNGTSTGDPAPIITESMRTKGLMDSPRGAVMGVAAEADINKIGRFNAVVDGFRYSTKQMNAAAWDIYTSIIDPGASLDDVKALFYEDRDVANLLMGRFKVEYINEDQARAAAFAMRDLTDRFLGSNVTRSSARVMDTLGREASTIAEAVQDLAPVIDENRAMDLVIDKLQFLMDEYGLNKYISGWRLRNKNWFDQIPPGQLDEAIEGLTQEFKSAEASIHTKNVGFTKELLRLADENPAAMRPLVDAFAHTNGDVDSLAKLMTWAANQVTPSGLLKSPDPTQLNLFARSTWGVIYNNVLSGISAMRAAVGNTSQLILRPITGILGHGIWGAADDFEGLKRAFYYNGAVFETNRRALKDAYRMMKRAHKDPELMMKAYRKDFLFKEDTAWDIMKDMREVWVKEGNFGRVYQYDLAVALKEMANMPGLRYGMTAMVFPDVFTNTHIAHYLSRMRAYDDVFTEFGFADWKKIALAEKEHYKNMFDANGLIKDNALKSLSGEISLNLDDGLATWINKGTTAYPVAKHMFMFPRTGSNYVKNALSWTPVSLIPGINKYSKTIWARTDDQIAAALAEHGIDMATTPNAKILFQNLRAEYTGRLAFSSLLTKGLWDYAMAGNIRGNGHYNASRRNKERDQLGYVTKTINIGGKWVSFKGIPGVDPVLSILGDMAYYAGDIDSTFMEDWQSKLMWTIAATFLNETPLQGLEPLVAATSGDLSGWNRFAANATRAFIPLSGAAGVLSNAITSSQKALEGEIHEYIMNRLPGLSSMLPNQIDIWTGSPLNDIDNPFLRMLNAVSPIKVSGTREPWRVWLESTGWDGMSRLRKDSTGSYEYSAEEREIIYKYMGEQQMFKDIEKLMKSKRYNDEIGLIRAHRATGDDLTNENIKIETQKLPVIQEINNIVRYAQKVAEIRLLNEARTNPKLQHIPNAIMYQQLTDRAVEGGDIDKARELQKQELETRQLLQMSK